MTKDYNLKIDKETADHMDKSGILTAKEYKEVYKQSCQDQDKILEQAKDNND